MKREPTFIKIGRKLRPLFLIRSLEKILKVFLKGNPNNPFLTIMIPPSYMYKKDTYRMAVCNGIRMKINLRHYNDHLTYWFFKNNILLQNIIDVIRPDYIVMDVGVNIGYYLLNFANKAKKGYVHGFEPNPIVYDFAKNNCNLNPFQNIKLNNIGLGHCKNLFEMSQINDNLGMNRIVASGTQTNIFLIEVEKLDDYVSMHSLARVDVMKIDVEGFEMNVLLGAEQTIIKWKPSLFIEIDEENLQMNNGSFKAMNDWLTSKGYIILNALTLTILTKEDVTPHFDILAIHSEKKEYFSKFSK